MNQLTWSADIANLLFGCVAVWCAHHFFQSSRRRWQCVLAWAASFLFCGIVTPVLYSTGGMGGLSYERISMLAGICCVGVYIYLFPQIPLSQRLFIYFFINNSMYLMVMAARYLGAFISGLVTCSADAVFLILYVVLVALGTGVFLRKSLKKMRELLVAVPSNSARYALLAICCCLVSIVFVDAWGPVGTVDLFMLLKILLLCATIVISYYVAFSSLAVMRSVAEKELYKKMAFTDRLTGIGNRLAYDRVMENKNRQKEPVLLIYLDINEFKVINDTFGHPYGDRLLKEHADYLRLIAGERFLPFRVGGDEFVLVSMRMPAGEMAAERAAVEKCLDSQRSSESPISFSWGCGCLTDYERDSIPALEKRCDEMMYRNKDAYKKDRKKTL